MTKNAKDVESVLSWWNGAKFGARKWLTSWKLNTNQLKDGKSRRIAGATKTVNAVLELKKMNNKPTPAERRHLAIVKEMNCVVCGASGPSGAHHIVQHLQYTCIPLCKDCHQGSFNGIHGQQRIWKVKKITEMSALNETLRQLLK